MTLIMAIILPLSVNAQTADEKWVSLGEYIQNDYKNKGKYLVPNYTNTFLYVTKIAFKTPDEGVILPSSDLNLYKINYIEDHGIPVFYNNEPIVVNENFDIKVGGNPNNKYKITDGETGWKILDLGGATAINSVLLKKKSKTPDNTIFDHIYVSLDPSQDPAKIKEDILKAKAEKKLKAEQTKNSSNQGIVLPSVN